MKAGCTFNGYQGYNFDGESVTLQGPLVDPNGNGFNPNPVLGYGSMRCICGQI